MSSIDKDKLKTTEKSKTTKSKTSLPVKKTSKKANYNEILKGLGKVLSKEELKKFEETYSKIKSVGKAKAKLIRPIVPIEEWVNDEYYIGQEVHNIYPYWKQEIINIFNSPTKINQVILTGAIGVGKSTVASVLMIRKLYELSCYENISALYKLMGISQIAFAYLSVTLGQATNTGFSNLREWIDSIQYFRDYFPRQASLDSLLMWPQERLLVTVGSSHNHFIGMNLICSILDEANFFGGSSDDSSASLNNKVAKLYNQIMDRAASRFMVDGQLHSLSILVSSSTTATSFTEEQIKKARENNDLSTYVCSPAQWDVKPWEFAGQKWFYVYVGGEGFDPHIINSIHDMNVLITSKGHQPLPIDMDPDFAYSKGLLPEFLKNKLVKAPEVYRYRFAADVVGALQNLAGYSSNAKHKLFNSRDVYNKSIDDTLTHPFTKEEFTISTTKNVYQEGYLPIKSYLKNEYRFAKPHLKRFVHVDLAVTGDAIGIAQCYIDGYKTIDGKDYKAIQETDDEDFVEQQIRFPIVKFDYMLRLVPPPKPERLSFSKVRDWFIYLRDEHNINFELITFDTFQSEQIRQELRDFNFNIEIQSVDRTTAAYDSMIDMMFDGRVKIYQYATFERELFGLDKFGGAKPKVDHPVGGSKDVTDAVAGAVFNALKSKDKTGAEDANDAVMLFNFANADPMEAMKQEIMAELMKEMLIEAKKSGAINENSSHTKLTKIKNNNSWPF